MESRWAKFRYRVSARQVVCPDDGRATKHSSASVRLSRLRPSITTTFKPERQISGHELMSHSNPMNLRCDKSGTHRRMGPGCRCFSCTRNIGTLVPSFDEYQTCRTSNSSDLNGTLVRAQRSVFPV